MSDKTIPKKQKNKLAEMTEQMSGSLDFAGTKPAGNYEYSTAYLAPKAKQVIGMWKVIEHTVDGKPYAESFCASTFKDIKINNVAYDATYEFTQNLCIKRVRIYGELDLTDSTSIYEYRMNIVLSWELKPNIISVLPVLGYQYSILDGKPAAVKDLPPSNSWMNLSVKFEYDYMILEDGNDIKTLARSES